jgi:uncharacterized membrane protein
MSRLTIEAWWPLLVALALLPLVLWMARRSASSLAPRHRRVLTVVRLGALLCAIGALLRPVWLATAESVSVAYLLDVSRSIDPGYVDAAIRWIDAADRQGRPARSRFIAFADRPRSAGSAEDIRKVPVARDGAGSAGAIDQAATDIEAALDMAADGFAAGELKRVVLISDGNATVGDAWRSLDRLRRDGVRVFTLPAAVRSGSDAWVEGIDVPAVVQRDEPTVVTVRVYSQFEARGRVTLSRDGRPLGRRDLTLAKGTNRVPFTVRMPAAGTGTLVAEIAVEGDTLADNDRATAALTVQPRPRVLYVEGAPETAAYLRDALARAGLDVTVGSVAGLPATPAGLEPYGAVILSDVAAQDLGESRMQALATYVRDAGGGLVFASGERTYGEAGYRESALERVLPVTFEAQEKQRDIALVIVLDRSYSMKGRKLDLAKAATLGALDLLEERHRFGVITFDSQPDMTVPLAPVRSKRKAEDLIARFTAGGQTNIYPALQTAYRVLADVKAKTKHVILLSDGDTQAADFQRLATRMAEAKMTVTTVAIGSEADLALMENIARWGKGRFYHTVSPERVPQIFADETRRVVNQSLVEEPVRAVVKRKAEMLRGIDFAAAPALRGFVSTKPKDSAEQYLVTDTGAPLLARWQVGLGKAVVFTSDVKNRWAADWLGWPGYATLWSQVVRETLRRDAGEQVDFAAVREGTDVVLTLTVLDAGGGFRDALAPVVSATAPDGTERKVTLRQVGPGRYEGRAMGGAAGTGAWRFALTAAGGVGKASAARAAVRELHRPFPDELRLLPTNLPFLRALAEQTGGRFAPEPAEVFASYGDGSTVPRPLWPWFAAAALALYLLDLAIRRVPWVWHRLA